MPREGSFVDYLAHWVLFLVLAAIAVAYFRRYRGSPSRLQLVGGNALVLLAILGGLAVAGETYLRYVYDDTMWHGGALTMRKWFARHEKLNSFGWRDPEFRLEKAPGVERIVFLGDSFTWGYGIEDLADRFPDRVRAELQRRASGRYEVWNIGKIGATTADELKILEEMLARCPVDRVVLMYSPNDVQDLLSPSVGDHSSWSVARPGSLRARSFLLDHLVIRLSVADTSPTDRYYAEMDAFHANAERFASQAVRMRAFDQVCRAAGVRLQVAVFPLISHWGPDYPFDAWHDRIEEEWIRLRVPVVDLREAWRGKTRDELRVNEFDDHPNEYANGLVAEALLEQLF